MTEKQQITNENVLVLVPLRSGQRLAENPLSFPSRGVLSLQESRVIGRKEFLPCLYAACGCDGKIRSSKNKCSECSIITFGLAKYITNEALQIVGPNTVKCRGGGSGSVYINSVQVSSNESWSEQIQLESRMILSFTTSFEMLEEGNIELCFEVVSIPQVSPQCENIPQRERQMAAGKKRPLQKSSSPLRPNKEPKRAIPQPKPSDQQESCMPSPRKPVSLPLSVATTHSQTSIVPKYELAEEEANESLSVLKKSSSIGPLNEENSMDLKAQTMPANKYIKEKPILEKPSVSANTMVGSVSRARSPATEAQVANSMPVANTASVQKPQTRLFFCPLGQDMSRALIVQSLSPGVMRLGAVVVKRLEDATHLILGTSVESWEMVAKRLGMKEKELVSLLASKNIKAMKVQWIRMMQREGALREPLRREHWMVAPKSDGNKKPKREGILQPKRTRLKKEFKSNSDISAIFKELAELYQKCPIEETDTWRAYQFRINAGRVKLLGFELTFDSLERLKKDVMGFGGSCIDIIKQYLEGKEIDRIHILKTDERRVAMHTMMDIWGVGRHTAEQLVDGGCRSIDDVKRKLTENTLRLDRNQLVGVDCYEDILDRMSRPEAAQIGETIKAHVLNLFPGAEVELMGSYKRGKETCGDVDVHITSPEFAKRVPKDALSSIVDSLWRAGEIAFHLTFLFGMETGNSLCHYQQAGRNLDPSVWGNSKALKTPNKGNDEATHSMYMGVFNSPLKEGTRRRIDIKFYPWSEKVFAAIYFTGNGFFNRSMRLWARQRGWQLNDSGLYKRGEKHKRILEPKDEKEVFDMLELVYKEPHERDSFDALEPKNGTNVDFEPSSSERDFGDYKTSKWIE